MQLMVVESMVESGRSVVLVTGFIRAIYGCPVPLGAVNSPIRLFKRKLTVFQRAYFYHLTIPIMIVYDHKGLLPQILSIFKDDV